MEDMIPLILIALICIIVGIVVGILLASLRDSKDESGASVDPNLVEVARMWRDQRTNGLILEVDGRNFQDAENLSVAQHNRLIRVSNELHQWLDVSLAEVSLERLSSISTPTNTVSSSGAAQGPPRLENAVLEALREDVKPVSTNPIDALVRAVRGRVSQKTETPKSIAAEVDEILQEKLESSPLTDRAIRLMELPEKGMVVLVGLEQFDGVGSIPYPEIRELLKECVAEWERRVDKA